MPNDGEPRVVDLGVACLVCLTEEPGSTSIYSHDLEPPHMLILDKIRRSTGLQLECRVTAQMQRWPDKICQQCRIELTVAYRFREKVATVEKLFESAVLSPQELEQELEQQQHQQMQLKLELEHHQLRLPATLKIKRLEMEPVAASIGSVSSAQVTATESPYYQEIVEEAEEEEEEVGDEEESVAETVPAPTTTTAAVTLLPHESMVLSLADLDETDPIKMGAEDLSTSDDDGDNEEQEEEEEEDKLLGLAPWDNDQTPEHLYEIETPIMEEELPPPPLPPPPPPPPPPGQANSKLRKRTYRRVSPIVKQDSGGRAASSDLDKDFLPVAVASSKRRQSERSPKICDVCGNTYKYQHALNAHMRRHNNERPYPCEVCQKAFISNVELRRHMRVHTGQKPYGCKFCDRRFSDFGSSKKHERIHTGERPYVCEVCHKGFAYAHVLSVHRRTHTGKKQFQCTKCDKGFTKKSYLSAHMDQHRGTGSGDFTGEEGQAMGSGFSAGAGAGSLRLHARKPDTFSLDSVVLGEQNKVLEECIVTNDFMFNDEDEDDGGADVDENEEAEAPEDADDHHESYPPQPDFDDVDGYQSVRSVKELVGDLLDSEEFDADSKYLID